MWITSVVGTIYLVFRFFVCEFAAKPVLKDETLFFSRFCSYYLGFAMIFDWKLISLNAIIATTTVAFIIISILTDFRPLIHPEKMYPGHTRKEYFWMKMERITLHWPMIAAGVWMIASGFLPFVNESHGYAPFVIAGLLFYIPYLFLDKRFSKKHDWPYGAWILFSSFCQVGVMIFIIIRW